MKTFTREIDGVTVRAEAEATLENQVLGVFEILSSLPNGAVARGETVELGWGPLIPEVLADGSVRLRTPDYSSDPYTELTYDLTIALWVLYEQVAVARQYGSSGKPTRFDDKVFYSKGALETEQRTYATRSESTSPADSGWFVGFVPPGDHELEATRAYRLLTRRRPLIPLLSLTPGFLVVMTGDKIQSVRNAEGEGA